MAVGHGMMGASMSASTGQLLADMIAGRTPCVNPAPFDPARFAWVRRSRRGAPGNHIEAAAGALSMRRPGIGAGDG